MDKRYLIAIVLCAAAGIILFTLAYPAYQRTQLLERLIGEREEELAAQNALVKEIGKLRAQHKQIKKETNRVFDLLPSFSAQSVPELFIELEGLASQNGVLLETISFANQGKIKGAGGEEHTHKTVNAQFSLKGTYNDVKRFAQAVETSEHLMDATAISLAAPLSSAKTSEEKKEPQETQGGADLFSLKVSLDAYYQ